MSVTSQDSSETLFPVIVGSKAEFPHRQRPRASRNALLGEKPCVNIYQEDSSAPAKMRRDKQLGEDTEKCGKEGLKDLQRPDFFSPIRPHGSMVFSQALGL